MSTDSVRRLRSEYEELCGDYVIQVVNEVHETLTLFEFKCDACTVQQREDFVHTFYVFLRYFAQYGYSVEVDEDEFPFNAEQDHFYGMLKCAG